MFDQAIARDDLNALSTVLGVRPVRGKRLRVEDVEDRRRRMLRHGERATSRWVGLSSCFVDKRRFFQKAFYSKGVLFKRRFTKRRFIKRRFIPPYVALSDQKAPHRAPGHNDGL